MYELLLLIFLLIFILSIVITTLKVGISPMPSNSKVTKEIIHSLKYSDNTIIELGSGFGFLAINIAKKFPNKKIKAFEISLFPYIISILLVKILNIKNLEVYRKDFLLEPLDKATLVCYLFPKGMEKLEDKLFDETINTKIISSTFAFRHIKEQKKIIVKDILKTPIYIYHT